MVCAQHSIWTRLGLSEEVMPQLELLICTFLLFCVHWCACVVLFWFCFLCLWCPLKHVDIVLAVQAKCVMHVSLAGYDVN